MSRLRDALYAAYAKHYERGRPGINPTTLRKQELRYMERTYGALVNALRPGSKVLDLGCGTGILLYWLSTKKDLAPWGVEHSKTMVETAKTYLPNLNIAHQDGLAFLRGTQERFAGIFCTAVLEHIQGEDLLLEWVEAAADRLESGGFFCCLVPNAANLLGGYYRHIDLTHERAFTTQSILQLLEAAGLQDCRVLPVRPGRLLGVIRQKIETWVHKFMFMLCGDVQERNFSADLIAVGFKNA
jgi:predicted TPR repeat methyltransferase